MNLSANSDRSSHKPKLYKLLLRLHKSSVSIRLRLFGFMAVLILLLFLLVMVILLITGTLTAGQREIDAYFTTEIDRLSSDIERDFGQISISAVSMAENIAKSSEQFLLENGVEPSNIQTRADLLEPLLDSQFDRLVMSLEKARASGVFLIYDATVNDSLDGAQDSRAGLYIKNMEPNIVSASAPRMTMMRGFADLGRRRGYALHSLWSMEFDVEVLPEYMQMRKYNEDAQSQELTDLYIWGQARSLDRSSEQYMPCIVPLIDSEGNFFGVCGFEVSSMLFKLNYNLSSSSYRRITSLLSPVDEHGINLSGALAGGEYNSFSAFINKVESLKSSHNSDMIGDTALQAEPSAWLLPVSKKSELTLYRFEGVPIPNETAVAELQAGQGSIYAGLHADARLLPNSSVYSNSSFATVLLMPESELSMLLGRNNLRIVIMCLIFIFVGVLTAVIMSKRFVRPIIRGLEIAATCDEDCAASSNIAEIRELIEQLRDHHEQNTGQRLPDNLFDDFLGKLETLTPTEKQLAAHYMHGLSTSEILSTMFISPSTLKTHSSHIYNKLNISSRDELQLYFKLMEKCGRLQELSERTRIS